MTRSHSVSPVCHRMVSVYQYIVKPPNCQRAVFKWHTDADFQEEGTERKPYLSVWCALDDVHEGAPCGIYSTAL